MPCGPVTIGRVIETPDGVSVLTSRPDNDNLGDTVSVVWHDKRQISPEQRRKAHALVGEICEWAGYYGSAEHTEMNTDLKGRFLQSQADMIVKDMFSLADCDMTTARNYITYLIDFVLRHDVPTRVPLIQLCDDIEKYVYACLMNKKCAVCGKKAEFHHVDHVGMGRNRREICHTGMRGLPLCREHHDQDHVIGEVEFEKLYHLIPIPVDEKIAKQYKLKHEEEEDGSEQMDDGNSPQC